MWSPGLCTAKRMNFKSGSLLSSESKRRSHCTLTVARLQSLVVEGKCTRFQKLLNNMRGPVPYPTSKSSSTNHSRLLPCAEDFVVDWFPKNLGKTQSTQAIVTTIGFRKLKQRCCRIFFNSNNDDKLCKCQITFFTDKIQHHQLLQNFSTEFCDEVGWNTCVFWKYGCPFHFVKSENSLSKRGEKMFCRSGAYSRKNAKIRRFFENCRAASQLRCFIGRFHPRFCRSFSSSSFSFSARWSKFFSPAGLQFYNHQGF